MLKRYLVIAGYIMVGLLASLPLLHASFGEFIPWLSLSVVTALNLLAWSIVIAFALSRQELHKTVSKISLTLGIDTRFKSLDRLFGQVVSELERKNSSMLLHLLEKRISNDEELAKTLERIVTISFRLFKAESAELALFDKSTGLYHSSFVVGTPMASTSQAMLSDAAQGDDLAERPDVLVQPLAFAGAVLGTLRISLKNRVPPTPVDQQIIKLLALQGSLALINAQYTGELMKMQRSSDESLRAKTGFLANLSHEVRAPLGVMMNAVELVHDGLCGPVSQDQSETLAMVKQNGEHLLELINDVLDYAKVEAGRLQPQKVDIVLQDLLKDVTNVVRTQAEDKSHRLITREGEAALGISCDRRHARQMLINLLSNAIKYTPEGGRIEVWAERVPGNKIKIHVKDNGVGIDEIDREKVFAPFERIQHNYAMQQVGTGLGMSLTQKLANVNGGSIDFFSIPGEGSDFWLSFPAIELTLGREAPVSASAPVAKGKGEIILLVEKDPGERTMMARYLAHQGYKVAAAGSNREAVDIFKSGSVNLAVIDNNVIDDPHDDIVKTIRNSSDGKSLPIVLVSSRAFVFDIERYLKLGIDRCLIKPVPLADLGSICRKLIDGEFSGSVLDDDFERPSSQPVEASQPLQESRSKGVETNIITLHDRQRLV